MDDELGLEYMKTHCEPYTRDSSSPQCLIADGHSSHIAWVVQYALDHNIHLICLPSKPMHILQSLDVNCFAIPKTSGEMADRGGRSKHQHDTYCIHLPSFFSYSLQFRIVVLSHNRLIALQ